MCLKTISSYIYKISFGSSSKFIYIFFSFFFPQLFSWWGEMKLRDISVCFIDSNPGWAGHGQEWRCFLHSCSCPNQELGQAERTAQRMAEIGNSRRKGEGWALSVKIDGSSIPNQGKSGNERRQFWEEAEEPPAFDNDRIYFMCCSLRTFTITILLFMILRGWWSPAQTAGVAQERIPPALALPNHSLALRPDQQSSISAWTTGNKSVRRAR